MQNKQRKQQAWSLRALTEHTLATPGSAWRLVRNAADARAQRKSSTAAAIKRRGPKMQRSHPQWRLQSLPLAASRPLRSRTKPAGEGRRIKRKEKVEKEKTKAKKKKVLPEVDEESEEEQEESEQTPQTAPKVHAPCPNQAG